MQSSFKALNIESDDEPDDEIDDTKEIQIEDALKDYQTALKFHSQGPRFVKEAEEAYDTLFRSEIFKYPESQSEYARWEAFHKQQEAGIAFPIVTEVQTAQTAQENGPNALPQILHLSYKNRGQFHLDKLRALLELSEEAKSSAGGKYTGHHSAHIRKEADSALKDFAEALDKDELDLDLWRRAAKVSRSLGVKRMTRYCLEAALEDDLEEGTDEVLGMPSIEITLTGNDLIRVQKNLEDDLSLAQPLPLGIDNYTPPEYMTKHLTLYPFLPDTPPATPVEEKPSQGTERAVLEVNECSWAALGKAILRQLEAEENGIAQYHLGGAVAIVLKDNNDATEIQVGSPVVESFQIELDTAHEVPDPKLPQDDLSKVSKKDSPGTEVVEPPKAETENQVTPEEKSTPTENTLPTSIPLRKRSTDAADLPETADGGRARSKRIRARESILGEPGAGEVEGGGAAMLNSDLYENAQADTYLFEILRHISGNIGIEAFGEPKTLRATVTQEKEPEASTVSTLIRPMRDFYAAMQNWNDEKTTVLNDTSQTEDSALDSRTGGLSAYLESSSSVAKVLAGEDHRDGASRFISETSKSWVTLPDLAIKWIHCLMDPLTGHAIGLLPDPQKSSYEAQVWTQDLKQVFIQVVTRVDEVLFTDTEGLFAALALAAQENEQDQSSGSQLAGLGHFTQNMFELHLDAYTRMVSPNSDSATSQRSLQKARLDQWCRLAREVFMLIMAVDGKDHSELRFRHMWATVFHLRVCSDVDREHILLCIDDLRRVAKDEGTLIYLPNNATLPEISLEAADRELTKLETMDFFYSIFQKGQQDPVDLIERLEPVLMNPVDDREELDPAMSTESQSHVKKSSAQVLASFLRNASFTLRLSLWRRLREAYAAIEFAPKVIAIDLMSIGLGIADIKSKPYEDLPAAERQIALLTRVREIDALLQQVLKTAESQPDSLSCLDLETLRQALQVVADVWTLLHVMTLWDDYTQLLHKGAAMVNPFRSYPSESFHAAAIKLHEMQIRTLMLWYKLLGEAMNQLPDKFPSPLETSWEYLRHIHYTLGVRRLCKASDSMFLKFMRKELVDMSGKGLNCNDDLAQILWDLYELHFFSQAIVKQDHGCDADYLDRATALELIDFALEKASSIPVKDLIKSELGRTIEKLNSALSPIKSTLATMRNKKIFNAYMKGSLNPINLYRSLKGVLDVSTVPVTPEEAVIASKGWFFLRGQMALAKYRSSRAAGKPGDEEDLEEAVSLFGQDLEFSGERWETWFRLGQANDALLEEQVLWSAEKLNNEREELAQLQRASIHSYAMAVAGAKRQADASEETKAKLGELYFDFGMRIYSSARPPFSMQPFSLRPFGERYFSGVPGGGNGIYTRKAFKPMRSRQAWKFAEICFEKSRVCRPKTWQTEYMLGKCKWKQFTLAREEKRSDDARAMAEQAIDHFLGAVEQIPQRKDPARSEPTLEPIYKVVNVLHKLVSSSFLPPDDAAETIGSMLGGQSQFEANRLPTPCTASTFLGNENEWYSFILETFKVIRVADKAKWHHRIVFSAAKIMYEAGGRDTAAARTTKSYLLDEKMYSVKTLALSVWKPDNERPGRHWVYMMRYATFLVEILEQTQDIEAIQILTRRVRKKPAEFYHHEHLWPTVCNAHLRMHRRLGNVVENIGETLEKSMMNDDFGVMATQVEQWITSAAKEPNVLIDILKEMAELRRINANLMNATPIDKLCVDTYATLINNLGPTIRPPPKRNPSPAPSAQPVLAPAPQISRPPERVNPMSLNSLMNMDSMTDHNAKPAPAASLVAPVADAPTKPKARLVSMREITKRAYESVLSLSKPAAAPAGSTSASSSRRTDAADNTSTPSNVRIVIDSAPAGGNSSTAGTPLASASRSATPSAGTSMAQPAGATSSQASGARATVTASTSNAANHADSADESELSDLPPGDEDEEGDEEDDEDEAEVEDHDMDGDEGEQGQEHEGVAQHPGLRGGKSVAGHDGESSDIEMGDGDDDKSSAPKVAVAVATAAAGSAGQSGWRGGAGTIAGQETNAGTTKDAFSVLMKGT